MSRNGYRIRVKKPLLFLKAMIEHYCDNAFISFEGDLTTADFRDIPIVSRLPTKILQRNTIQPRQDFVILPLERNTIDVINKNVLNQIGLQNRILHILIAQNEELVVGIYDCFDSESVWVDQNMPESTLTTLKESGIIAAYENV